MTETLNRNLITAILGLISVLTVAGIIVLAVQSKTVPDSLIALASGATGTLGGALLPRQAG